jgi:ribonuclease P protein component
VLQKEHRLTSGRDFKAIFAGGKAFTNRLIVLKVMPSRDEQPSRFGFLTSSKLGKSVVRNRAKRLLREAVRLLQGRLQQTGYDAVLIARPGVPEASFEVVSKAVEELFRKAGRLATYKQSQEGHQNE